MRKILSIDYLLKFFRTPKEEPIMLLNVSDFTNEWNELALKCSRIDRFPPPSDEEMIRQQEESYRTNAYAIEISRKLREKYKQQTRQDRESKRYQH